MSSDTKLTAEDGATYSYDNLSTQRWLEGQIVGVETAAKLIRAKAETAFGAKRDAEAFALRKLADEIENELVEKARVAAARHKKDCPISPFPGEDG